MFRPLLTFAAAMFLACLVHAQDPLSTIFTYQGELRQSGAPVTTAVDLRFRLYDAATIGTQVGMQLTTTLTPTSGRFTTDLDFGSVFAGQNRWLEVDVRPAGGPTFTTLSPRQPLYATPNASFALNAAVAATATSATTAATATNATQLNGQTPSFYLNPVNFSGGTLPSGLLGGTYTGFLNLSNPMNSFTGIGSGLTSLNASNLSTGTLPDARLGTNIPRLNASNSFSGAINSFSGILHSTATGYRFPDNTVQTTAALDPGDLGFTSGYSSPSISVTINGVSFPTARMVGFWRIQKPAGGPPIWITPPTFRRPRTSDTTWFDWVQNGTTLSGLTFRIFTPDLITYALPAGRISSYKLTTGDDGLPFEDITYITGNSSLPTSISTTSGLHPSVSLPSVAPRLGESTGGPVSTTYRFVWNNSRNDNVVVLGNPVFSVPIDPSSGLQTGPVGSATVTIRLNARAVRNFNFSNALLTGASGAFRLVTHPSTGPDIDVTNNVTATFTTMIVRLADDGFPVEEYEVTFSLN